MTEVIVTIKSHHGEANVEIGWKTDDDGGRPVEETVGHDIIDAVEKVLGEKNVPFARVDL